VAAKQNNTQPQGIERLCRPINHVVIADWRMEVGPEEKEEQCATIGDGFCFLFTHFGKIKIIGRPIAVYALFDELINYKKFGEQFLTQKE
jgi:hypothetical protein